MSLSSAARRSHSSSSSDLTSQPLELPGHVDDLADTIAKRQVVRVWHPHLERRVDTDEPNSARRS
jgi:hypothetical protein